MNLKAGLTRLALEAMPPKKPAQAAEEIFEFGEEGPHCPGCGAPNIDYDTTPGKGHSVQEVTCKGCGKTFKTQGVEAGLKAAQGPMPEKGAVIYIFSEDEKAWEGSDLTVEEVVEEKSDGSFVVTDSEGIELIIKPLTGELAGSWGVDNSADAVQAAKKAPKTEDYTGKDCPACMDGKGKLDKFGVCEACGQDMAVSDEIMKHVNGQKVTAEPAPKEKPVADPKKKKEEPKKTKAAPKDPGVIHCPSCGSAGPWTILSMNLALTDVPATKLCVDPWDNQYDDTQGQSDGWDSAVDSAVKCDKCGKENDYNALVDMAEKAAAPAA